MSKAQNQELFLKYLLPKERQKSIKYLKNEKCKKNKIIIKVSGHSIVKLLRQRYSILFIFGSPA